MNEYELGYSAAEKDCANLFAKKNVELTRLRDIAEKADPFVYIEQLVGQGWDVTAGCFSDKDIYYLNARGHGASILGKGNDLIHAFANLRKKIEEWKHEQDDLDAKDQEDTVKSILADLHP
jgi:hypothetical protein